MSWRDPDYTDLAEGVAPAVMAHMLEPNTQATRNAVAADADEALREIVHNCPRANDELGEELGSLVPWGAKQSHEQAAFMRALLERDAAEAGRLVLAVYERVSAKNVAWARSVLEQEDAA